MTIETMRKAIGKDFETKHLTILDQDVLKVYNYIKQRDGSLGSQVSVGYELKLITEPRIDVIYQPQAVTLKKLEKAKKRMLIKTFDSLNYILDVELSDFEAFDQKREEALTIIGEFLVKIEQGLPTKGLYLHGRFSTGKTFLLSALTNALVERNIGVLFVYMPDLVRTIKSGFDDNSIEEKVFALKNAPILIFDDFGSENLTPWFRDEILAPILQHRFILGLPVLISSNLTIVEMVEHLSLTFNKEDTLRAARLIHRIKDATISIELVKPRLRK